MSGKALFRDHFRDYVEDELKESFDSQHDITRSKLMARFFAEKILAPRFPTLLPFGEEERQACAVDQKGDQGVDFISRENDTVLIIQAKFTGGKKLSHRPVEDPAQFEHFRNVLQRLARYRELEMCQPLRELCAEIDWQKDHFTLYYITLRQLSTNQVAGDTHTINSPTGMEEVSDQVDLHLLDEIKLNSELRDTLSIEEEASRPTTIRFTPNDDKDSKVAFIRLIDEVSGRSCYVGRVSGAQLANLYTQEHSRLFTLNIRNYIGDNLTNRTIRATALDAPDDFFFFNNGISALANRVHIDETDKSGNTLRCENLSVINGAQTVRSLHKAHVVNPDAVREVQVLLRLTEMNSKKTRVEQEFLDNVTKYNNTQNTIRISDFRSNDKVQYDIANRFAQLPAVDGKKFVYKNKRSGENTGSRTVGMEEFVKTVFAFRFGPDDVFGGTAYMFDATRDGGYTKLFGDNSGEILPALNNAFFEQYTGIWFLCNAARDIWRDKTAHSDEAALERRWMFYYGIGRTLDQAYSTLGRDMAADLRRLGDPSWTRKGAGDVQMRAISNLSKFTFKVLIDSYRQASSRPGFTHRNWYRSTSTLESLIEQVASSWELVAEHAEDYVIAKQK